MKVNLDCAIKTVANGYEVTFTSGVREGYLIPASSTFIAKDISEIAEVLRMKQSRDEYQHES